MAIEGFTRVAELEDLPPGAALSVAFEGDQVAIFNVEGQLYALSDFCTHAGAPLHDGDVCSRAVRCRWHAASFDLETGEPLGGPAASGVSTYPVQASEGGVWLGRPAVRPWTAGG